MFSKLMKKAKSPVTQATGPVIEGLEPRELLSRTITIVEDSTVVNGLVRADVDAGVINTFNGRTWTRYDTSDPDTNLVVKTNSRIDKHNVQVNINKSGYVDDVAIYTTKGTNFVNLYVAGKVRVQAWLANDSENHATTNITSSLAYVAVNGGMRSSNFVNSLNGRTVFKAGAQSASFFDDASWTGNDYIIGNYRTTLNVNLAHGRHTLVGGTYSDEVYNLKGSDITGKLSTGSHNRTRVGTLNGLKPAGLTVNLAPNTSIEWYKL